LAHANLIAKTISGGQIPEEGVPYVPLLATHSPGQNRAAAIARALRRRAPVKRFLACCTGSNAVEFGLVALPLFLTIIAPLQVGLVFLAQNEIETATEKAARLLLTGQQANYTQSQFASAVCGYLPALINCANLMIDVQTVSSFASANTSAPTLTYNAQGLVTNTWNYPSSVAPNSILALRVMYQFPVVPAFSFTLANLGNGTRLLIATSVFQVEPN
jgi:Flp pilus assembly protein TadG